MRPFSLENRNASYYNDLGTPIHNEYAISMVEQTAIASQQQKVGICYKVW